MVRTHLEVGERITDPEQDAEGVVVEVHDNPAHKHPVADTGKTVSEFNPDEPHDAPVVDVVLDVDGHALGLIEKSASVKASAGWADFSEGFQRGLQNLGESYSYPATRLEQGWDE